MNLHSHYLRWNNIEAWKGIYPEDVEDEREIWGYGGIYGDLKDKKREKRKNGKRNK
jgi:ribosome biogenesis SPOUT family RNA methylase Rps3